MSTFVVSGAELAVELSDEGGHPVVQLHGLTSSRARDRVLNLDLGRGLSGTRLLRYDARGHGKSTGRKVPQDYRWERLAEDLLRLLDKWFPGEQVHGVGPSMGTGTLLHAAAREPDRFAGLTLMVPATAWHTRPAQAANYRVAAEIIETEGVGAFIAWGRAATPPPATVGAPETVPDVADALLPSLFRGAALSDLPTSEALARIDVPTTILAWINDPAHPLSTAESLAALLPQSTLTVAHTPADVVTWPKILSQDVARRG
ncbi:hydrolase [Mycobacterium liflandii 128FXT]|uniref:Hydrolase n=1 Tax=Mycobacterium liflandii (strain 128FXT) TaxID=459424 RepID=L7UXV2_MYCL1|nr:MULTISPECIES: alpha/beta fold hydrolase [Mycobacterium ulcerans group]AGC60216.1 hydrolase [Mycobacterium liflandii 128FXT]RFZ55104.1 3-oxoadipate enol-lactonase 2 [Mycobacterium marinum]ULL08881.1 alpha/beta hydrolase [Mycobacterium liflandii]